MTSNDGRPPRLPREVAGTAIWLASGDNTVRMSGGADFESLADYYRRLGLAEDAWHVGPEHPSLEQLALRILAESDGARILEVGVQSGGFSVPVILEVFRRKGFAYTGIDNLAYTNAVPLRLIEVYLRQSGVAGPLRFLEGDSTSLLRAEGPSSYDFILLDHYKPKYPIDLYVICARELLSERGTIVLHDVLAHAAPQWRICQQICRAFGYVWTIDEDVFQGAAIIRRGGRRRTPAIARSLIGLGVAARWNLHAAIGHARRAAGRALRSIGLRP